jgi:hypothetical protein
MWLGGVGTTQISGDQIIVFDPPPAASPNARASAHGLVAYWIRHRPADRDQDRSEPAPPASPGSMPALGPAATDAGSGRQAGRALPLPLDIAHRISEHGCQLHEYLKTACASGGGCQSRIKKHKIYRKQPMRRITIRARLIELCLFETIIVRAIVTSDRLQGACKRWFWWFWRVGWSF